MMWFFAGAETRDNKFNVFTGSFIYYMKEIMGNDFSHVKGIYRKTALANLIWALNNSHEPVRKPPDGSPQDIAFNQFISNNLQKSRQLILVSSSTGSVVAAQTACFIAEKNRERKYLEKPFHLALGSTIISEESELYKYLVSQQDSGLIGRMIYDDLQDEGDNSTGMAGISRHEAYRNAFGILFPPLSKKFNGPSFLNTDPETGHIHRRRSKSIIKALDYIEILLIKHNLAGEYYRQRAITFIEKKRI